ncbi:MAG: hypothetical protein LBS43_04845 [Prevotellaceae bacterium]|jgi:uncharacterized membrane protein (DUF485 family)|nr:hypothetical protein [Prevotellaceae bacterium]
MEQDKKDKLLAYAIKMIERQDSFSDILLYLDRKGADKELKKEIIAKLEEHKKLLEIKDQQRRPLPVSTMKIVVGVLFLGLTLYMQYLGVITFPWTILGYIVAVGALMEIAKIFVNLFKSRKS